MSNLILTINCGNDAFGLDPAAEVARILRDAATRMESSGAMDGLILRDANGNTVGGVSWEKGDDNAGTNDLKCEYCDELSDSKDADATGWQWQCQCQCCASWNDKAPK